MDFLTFIGFLTLCVVVAYFVYNLCRIPAVYRLFHSFFTIFNICGVIFGFVLIVIPFLYGKTNNSEKYACIILGIIFQQQAKLFVSIRFIALMIVEFALHFLDGMPLWFIVVYWKVG